MWEQNVVTEQRHKKLTKPVKQDSKSDFLNNAEAKILQTDLNTPLLH